jgi:hypothetical protein
MAASFTVNFVAEFDADGTVWFEAGPTRSQMAFPKIAVARQSGDQGDESLPYLAVAFAEGDRRVNLALGFDDAARLAAILTSFTIAEQLKQDQERTTEFKAMASDDDEDENRDDE